MPLPAPRTALSVLPPAASGASQLHAPDAELRPAPRNKVSHVETLTQNLGMGRGMGKMKRVQEGPPEMELYRYYSEKTRVLFPEQLPEPGGRKKSSVVRKISSIGSGARKTEQKTDFFKAVEVSAHFWCENYLKDVDKQTKA